VGNDVDEALLQTIADAAQGHFYFIDSAQKIPHLITSEVGEVLEVAARDVTLRVRAVEGVRIEPLSRFQFETRGEETLISLGDLVSEQQLRVVIRLNFPYGEIGGKIGASFELADRDGLLRSEPHHLGWEYASDRDNDLQERDREVDRHVAMLLASRARQEAVSLNRAGDFQAAAGRLAQVADRIRGYAGHDPELGRIVAQLEGETAHWASSRPEFERKAAFAASAYALHDRDIQGRALRFRS
jgi:Ca-activated chloride channel family protein